MDRSLKDLSQENQQAALNYIKDNKIDSLFTEMINNVIHSGTNQPLVHMIKYLSRSVLPSQLERENIKIDEIPSFDSTPIIKEFFFPENTTIFLKKFIDPKVYDKLKGMRTSLGGHISHIIHAGLKADNRETVGIYATDGEAYVKFVSLFKPALDMLQDYDKNYALFDILNGDIFSNLKLVKDRLLAIKFKYARNIKGYPYLPYAKSHTKKEIKEKLLEAIMSDKANEKGKFYDLEGPNSNQEIEDKFFDKEENFFVSFNLSKEHSGIFVTEDEKIAYLINFNDHLQIIAYDQTVDFKNSYSRLKKAHLHLSLTINFDYNSEYGYLTSCPSNVGMGLKLSAWLTIPNTVNQGNFLVCCKRWSLRFKKNQISRGHKGDNEIISKHKIGVPETTFVNSFIVKLCSLINFENNLELNPKYVEKQLDVSKMKDNIKSIYQTFYDKYKFVVTPNMKSFNSLFKLNNNKNIYSVLIPDKESYLIFKDFIFDYITGFANINMVNTTSIENTENLKRMYTEKISEEELKRFDESCSRSNSILSKEGKGKMSKVTIILRRNIKKNNFSESLSSDKIKKNYERFFTLANFIKDKFGGTVIDDVNINSLYSSEFKFILEELSRETNQNHCAYVSYTDKSLILFNGVNHLKFVSISTDGTISANYKELAEIHEFIESKLKLEFDDSYGYLTCKPLNSGCAFELRLSFEDVNPEEFRKLAERCDLSTRKILSTGVEIFNRSKINLSPSNVIHKFHDFIKDI